MKSLKALNGNEIPQSIQANIMVTPPLIALPTQPSYLLKAEML